MKSKERQIGMQECNLFSQDAQRNPSGPQAVGDEGSQVNASATLESGRRTHPTRTVKNQHLDTFKCRNATSKAFRDGRIEKRDTCERCGCQEPLQTHHWDYANPFDIEQLCYDCHRIAHGSKPLPNGLKRKHPRNSPKRSVTATVSQTFKVSPETSDALRWLAKHSKPKASMTAIVEYLIEREYLNTRNPKERRKRESDMPVV